MSAAGREPTCRELAAFVAQHAEWLAAHSGVAGEVSEELDGLRRRAWTVAYPTGTRRRDLGHDCPMGGCDGRLEAIMRPQDAVLPPEVFCSVEPDLHRWSSSQWRQLDRLIAGRRAA